MQRPVLSSQTWQVPQVTFAHLSMHWQVSGSCDSPTGQVIDVQTHWQVVGSCVFPLGQGIGVHTLAGTVAELTPIWAAGINAIVVTADARRPAVRAVLQVVAEAALTGLRIHLVVHALRVTGMLATDAVTVTGQRLTRASFTLLTVSADVPTGPAVVAIGLGIDAGVIAQRLQLVALAPTINTGDIDAACVSTGPAIARIGLRVDAGLVAQSLAVSTGALPGNAFLALFADMTAGAAVEWIDLQIGAVAIAAARHITETPGCVVATIMNFLLETNSATERTGKTSEMPRSMATKGVVAIRFALSQQLMRLVLAVPPIADTRRVSNRERNRPTNHDGQHATEHALQHLSARGGRAEHAR